MNFLTDQDTRIAVAVLALVFGVAADVFSSRGYQSTVFDIASWGFLALWFVLFVAAERQGKR